MNRGVITEKLAQGKGDSEEPDHCSVASRPLPLSLRRGFLWTLAGNLIAAGCQWGIVVLLAKIASPRIVGEFALASAIAVPIAFLADFRLRVLFVTDAAATYSFKEMLGLRFALVCVSMSVLLATCLAARYEGSLILVIVGVGIAQLTDVVSDTYYGRFQRDERMDRIAISVIIRNTLSMSAFVIALYLTRSLPWGVFGLVLGRFAVLLLYDVREGQLELDAMALFEVFVSQYWERFRPAWNVRKQLRIVWSALPLAVAQLLVSVNGYMPRYVVEAALGRREVGIYTAISYIPSGCFLVVTALGYAVFARLSKLFAKGDLAGFQTLLTKTSAVYASLGVCGILVSATVGRQVLTIVYRPEYAEHVDLFRWLMVATTVQCLATGVQCGLNAATEFRVQVPVFGLVTAMSLVGCIAFVPRMGLIGAAVAILVSSTVQMCACTSLLIRAMIRRARELQSVRPQLNFALGTQN
jgi:O-antigen/teichoic acid export membrane protein